MTVTGGKSPITSNWAIDPSCTNGAPARHGDPRDLSEEGWGLLVRGALRLPTTHPCGTWGHSGLVSYSCLNNQKGERLAKVAYGR